VLRNNKLSIVIIAFNEEAAILRCIQSVHGLADEIVVVDSYSTDRTVEIAKNVGATVLQHRFEGHIQQKNWAKDQAIYNYVLSLDADESLSPELYASIQQEKENGFPFEGYSMNRLNHLKKRPIKGCGWYPDTKIRLWKKQSGAWAGTNPHDRFELNANQTIKHLNGDILHYTYNSYGAVWKQALKFGKIGHQSIQDTLNIVIFFKFLTSPQLKFLKNYFVKGGFLYGWRGFYICFCQWIESIIKYGTDIALYLVISISVELLFHVAMRLF
jgi:glycosyltransferase involved in cell wall biosynthesis